MGHFSIYIANDIWRKRGLAIRGLEKFHTISGCITAAIRQKDLDLVIYFAEKGDYRGNYNEIILESAEKGFDAFVDRYVKTDEQILYAINGYAMGGNSERFRYFFEKIQTLHTIDINNILRYATYGGNGEIILQVVYRGARNWVWAAEAASEGGNLEWLRVFIDLSSINPQELLYYAGRGGKLFTIFYILKLCKMKADSPELRELYLGLYLGKHWAIISLLGGWMFLKEPEFLRGIN